MDKLMNEWMVEYTSPFYPPYFWAIIPDTRAEQSGNIRSRAALAAVCYQKVYSDVPEYLASINFTSGNPPIKSLVFCPQIQENKCISKGELSGQLTHTINSNC